MPLYSISRNARKLLLHAKSSSEFALQAYLKTEAVFCCLDRLDIEYRFATFAEMCHDIGLIQDQDFEFSIRL